LNICDSEIKYAIISSSPKKAPGPDGITFEILHHVYTATPNVFNILFKNLLRNGIGAVLPKPNKPKDIPKGYRIITLLNCLGKVSEKILANRLSYMAPKILDLGQMGGIKNRSAIDAVLGLVHDIQLAEHQKRKITATFFDIKGAFDFVSLKQLLDQMLYGK